MKINNRLKKVSEYIKDDSYIIDVGCDHALLDIYLINNKNNIKCIASDINSGPLKQAKENIKKFELTDKIEILQTDGIDDMPSSVDTIVISGLGGLSIIDILKKNKHKLDKIKQIVLSPNTDFYEVRKEVTKLGFIIEKEEIFKDKDKYYLIISFIKGKKKYKKIELMYGTNVNKEYLKSLLKVNKYKLKSIPKKNIIEVINVKKNIKLLKKII